MMTALSVFREYSGSQGSVNGLLRKCGSKPSGMSVAFMGEPSGLATDAAIERQMAMKLTAYKVLNGICAGV
jgi:hypothetical protein